MTLTPSLNPEVPPPPQAVEEWDVEFSLPSPPPPLRIQAALLHPLVCAHTAFSPMVEHTAVYFLFL